MLSCRAPENFASTFEANFNQLDPAALASTYTPDAVLNLGGGSTFKGQAAIQGEKAQLQIASAVLFSPPTHTAKGALANFMAAKLPMKTTHKVALQDGTATAVVFFDWAIEGTGPDGAPVKLGGCAADVLRLVTGDSASGPAWRCVLDHPFGAATASAPAADA